MECNKDEAARAKEMAEMKFFGKDYASAKKFALKALCLYPPLEGISQFVTNLDVYISAENKVNGQMDWYGILGVNPFADEETVRVQYRKLALALHPDKNKSLGAEGAFKLVSEAWSLLSDKVKRLAYNRDRSSGTFQHNALNRCGSRSEAPSSNAFRNLNKNPTSNVGTRNNNARPPSTSVPRPQKIASSFWTSCSKCGTHYEYLRTYLNHTLMCPTCSVAFVALEKDPPPRVVKASNLSSRQRIQKSQHHTGRNHPVNPGRTSTVSQNTKSSGFTGMPFNSTDFQSCSHLRMADSVRSHGSSSVAGASVMQQVGEKRGFQGSPSIATWERNLMYKKSDGSFRKDDIRMHMVNRMTKGEGATNFGHIYELGQTNLRTERTRGFSGITSRHHSRRELSMSELQNMLVNKAQSEIRKKLQEWRSMAEAKVTDKDKGNKRQKSTITDKRTGPEKHRGSTIDGNRHVDSDYIPVTSDDTMKNQAYVTINVPDSDFHNFDMDRAENSFTEDQVWAAYDDDDGMPRYYAKIHTIISAKPFRIRISCLNSRSNSELGPIDWVGSGFYKTCGDFRIGKYEITESLNSFSHKVRWTKGNRGVVCIFPGKGEVWALYKNWSPDWNQSTPDEVIHKYDMVEVLENFNEEEGVLVIPLVKVDGFRTVFQKLSQDQVRKIPKVELFRFSHQVPNYVLTGQESPNAPKGCQELDPAATPLDLLQTVTEPNETFGNVGKSNEDKLPCSPEKHTSGGSGENASKPIVADSVDDRPFKNVYKRKGEKGKGTKEGELQEGQVTVNDESNDQ